MSHDPNRIYGENAAGNTGRGSWGTKREPEQILTRFVEYELDWPWPRNGHLTQVLWRVSYFIQNTVLNSEEDTLITHNWF